MKKRCMFVSLGLVLVFLLAGGAQAIEIFVWQHDNNLTQMDPVYGTALTATLAVTRALSDLDLDFDMSRNLPDIEALCDYDVVIVCLSFFCPG